MIVEPQGSKTQRTTLHGVSGVRLRPQILFLTHPQSKSHERAPTQMPSGTGLKRTSPWEVTSASLNPTRLNLGNYCGPFGIIAIHPIRVGFSGGFPPLSAKGTALIRQCGAQLDRRTARGRVRVSMPGVLRSFRINSENRSQPLRRPPSRATESRRAIKSVIRGPA
ncbi:unnamed protein product, partial [Pleuronectes platessa]